MNRRRFAQIAAATGLSAASVRHGRVVARDAAAPAPGTMPMARGNPAHTGEQPGPGPNGDPVVLWRFTTNAPIASSPAVWDGRVFAGNDDGYLFALDAAQGTALWGVELGERIRTTPAIHDEFVFVANGAFNIRGARTGDQVNRLESDRFRITASLIPAETSGRVAIFGGGLRGASGFVDSRDPISGRSTWRQDVINHTTTSPTVIGETVLVGTLGGELLAFNAADGAPRWQLNTAGGIFSAPAAAGGLVYVNAWAPALDQRGAIIPNASGSLHAIDLETGLERWRTETGNPVDSGPAVAAGAVFVGGGNALFAFDARTGQPRWRFETGAEVRSSPAVAEGVVYVGSGDGHLYALETETGALRWHLPFGVPIDSTPAVVDGVVFLTAGDSVAAVGGV